MWKEKKAWDRFSRLSRTSIGLSVISLMPCYTSMCVLRVALTGSISYQFVPEAFHPLT